MLKTLLNLWNNQLYTHSFQPDGKSRCNQPVHGVSTAETLTVVRDKLEERTCIPIDDLMEMLTFCVETTYFDKND